MFDTKGHKTPISMKIPYSMYQKKNRGLSPIFVAYVKKGQNIDCTGLTTVYYLDNQSIK
jgi:hypothetical protein